jgi:RHS repeat-associated protein
VIAEGDSTILKRWYAGGNYEKDSTAAGITERIYLGGDAYSAPAVLVRRTGRPDTFFSIGRDYQGSITYLRSKDGQESYEYNYDPWGNVRYADGDTLALSYRQVPEMFLGRGYTGHEHLPYFGLINMNARLYDPVTTRFLSPDPFIQAPHDFQNYNRYSYCLNNPLKYTDESGEYYFWDDLFAALAGGVINWATNGCKFSWEGLSYFGVGAATGWASLYISPVLASGLTSGANSIISQGFGNNGQWSWSNINWGSAAFSAIVGGATSYLGGQLSSMVSNSLGKLTSRIPGKAWAGMLNKGVSGFVSGFTVGGAINALNQSKTDDPFEWKSFWSSALNTGLMGLANGAITGTAEGIIEARANNENPWAFTEKQLNPRRVVVHLPSLGAQSRGIQVKKISKSFIKMHHIPAHDIKRDWLGRNANIDLFDLFKDPDGWIWIYKKNGSGEGILTDLNIYQHF